MMYDGESNYMAGNIIIGAFLALGVGCLGALIADCQGRFDRDVNAIAQDLVPFTNCQIVPHLYSNDGITTHVKNFLECDLSAQQQSNPNTLKSAVEKKHELEHEVFGLSDEHQEELQETLKTLKYRK